MAPGGTRNPVSRWCVWPRETWRPRPQSIRDALERPLRVPSKELPPNTDLRRAPLLEAQVEIEIAAGDIDRARSAADELTVVAARFQSKALAAGAALAHGRVHLAAGNLADAERFLSDAVRLWNEVGAPYEAALARSWPRRGLPRRRRRAPGRPGAPGRPHGPGPDRSRRRGRTPRHRTQTTTNPKSGPSWAATRFVSRVTTGRWCSSERTVRMRDLQGMRYLARLLADPGREFHVLDLVAAEADKNAQTR